MILLYQVNRNCPICVRSLRARVDILGDFVNNVIFYTPNLIFHTSNIYITSIILCMYKCEKSDRERANNLKASVFEIHFYNIISLYFPVCRINFNMISERFTERLKTPR